MKSITSSVLLVTIALLIPGLQAWSIVSSNGPSIRSWPATASYDDGLLAFGGVYDDFTTNVYTFYDDLYTFNPTTNSWTQTTPSNQGPSPRMTTARFVDKRTDRFYLYGGTNYNADFSQVDIYGDLWYYDIIENSWTLVQPLNNGPGPRTGAVMTIHGNSLYLFGGLDSYFGGKSDVWEFHIPSRRWTELIPSNRFAARPTGMQYSPFHYYHGDLIVGPGEGGIETYFGFINEWWTFNLGTKVWVPMNFTNSYGVARNYIASALYAGKVFIYGGDTPSNDPPCCGAPFPQNPTNETWVLDLGTATWTSVQTPGVELKRHLGALLDDKFYVVGGWGWESGQVWNPDTLVLDLDEAL